MAAIKILYTDVDAIRSAIGVDDDDIEDTVITGQGMELQMAYELGKIVPDHETLFDTDLGEVKLRLWCMWFGALRLAESPLAVPKRFGTGKDEMERFTIDWDALKAIARAKLAELTVELVPTYSSSSTVMGKATPGYNPIEGP